MASSLADVKALVFDLMGTCTDWKSNIVAALHEIRDAAERLGNLDEFAQRWRQAFFDAANEMAASSDVAALSDIDSIHLRTLRSLLGDEAKLSEAEEARLVQAWHFQRGWSDSAPGLRRLKKRFDVVVLANGTTRLQLDITRSADLPFSALLSSQLLGSVKPRPEMYRRACELLALRPSQVAMVAAHAYDTAAAKQEGFRTIYIHRTTEDVHLDMQRVAADNDLFIDSGGLEALADHLGL